MFVQNGDSFSNSETVIYAKADYKPRMPEIKSLSELIKNDTIDIREEIKNLKIISDSSIKNKEGKQITVISFIPFKEGNWESVAYSEEGEFYLLFTISSRTENGFKKNLQAFKEMVKNYKENH